MSEYISIFKTWRGGFNIEAKRNISLDTLDEALVTIEGNEAIFPYGKNRQEPDRFKVINIVSKKQYFSALNPKLSTTDDYKPPLFNQQDFKDKSYIIITEGEWDCLSWIQEGYKNTVSIPNGCSSARAVFQREFSYINSFNTIYINFDSDEPGKKAVEDIKDMIPKYKFRNICISLDYCKDANDVLKRGGSFEEFFEYAERLEMETIVHISNIDFESIFNATPRGLSTGFVDFDEILGGIRPGEVTVLTGDTGSGKTTFAINIAYNIALKEKKGILISSQEMRAEKIAEKLGSIAINSSIRDLNIDDRAKTYLHKVFKDNELYVNTVGEKITLESLLDIIDAASYSYKIKLIVVEDLGYIASSVKEGDSREKFEYAIQTLHSKALETGIHILLVVHPTQTKDDTGVMGMANLKGSSGIKQYADNIVIIQRLDRAYPNKPKLHKYCLLKVTKNRALGKEGRSVLEYHPEYDGYSNALATVTQVLDLTK